MQMEQNQDLAMVVLVSHSLAFASKIGPNDKREEIFWLDFLVLNAEER
jgi:hypothetical protein